MEAPAALLANDDPYAQMAAGWIEMANSLSGQLAMFTPPTGAVKSTTAITPANGRTAATSVVVWTWSDANYEVLLTRSATTVTNTLSSFSTKALRTQDGIATFMQKRRKTKAQVTWRCMMDGAVTAIMN